MNCRSTQSKLNRYLDGELSVRDRDPVEQHLRKCLSCRNELERLRVAADVMAALPEPPEVPALFAERVMSRAARNVSRRGRLLGFWQSVSPPMRIAAAAVLVIGLGVGIGMGWQTSIPPTVQAAETAQSNALDAYQLEYLNEAPSGSLADNYLTLVTADTTSR